MESSGAERQGKKSRDGDRVRDIGDGKMLQKRSQGKMNEEREVRIEKKKRTNKGDGKQRLSDYFLCRVQSILTEHLVRIKVTAQIFYNRSSDINKKVDKEKDQSEERDRNKIRRDDIGCAEIK